ncbi:MAG TPA: PilZ domain-containing protein [Gammaproteobacteria bacterium]|nr:PilZ domain-containing protein [Gammaproteobacteria bacterium]
MRTDGRRYPRYTVRLPVEIRTGGDEQFSATLENISLGGLELSCDRWTAERILPPGHQAFPGQPIGAEVRFAVPLAGGAERTVEIFGEIVVSRRLAQNEYRIGMQFVSFSGEASAVLDRYIASRGG